MATLLLHSAQEDRHRAVLLADFLNSLGTRCELNTAPANQPGVPVLVVWTRAAARTPWLLDLFTESEDAVALVIDAVALPARCDRAVDLTSWPARSADTQVAGLVRWLAAPDRGGDFGRATQRRLQRHNRDRRPPGKVRAQAVDRTGIGALVLLGLAVAVVTGLVMREDSATPVAQSQPQPQPQPQLQAAVAAPGSRSVTGTAGARTNSGEPDTDPERTLAVLAEQPALPVAVPLPEQTAPPPPDQRSSLAHLCQAASPAAALAWYRVLDRRARAEAREAACVRELLQRPGYEALEDLLAQS